MLNAIGAFKGTLFQQDTLNDHPQRGLEVAADGLKELDGDGAIDDAMAEARE